MAAELHYLLFDQLKDIFSKVFSLVFIHTYSEITIITIKIIFCGSLEFVEVLHFSILHFLHFAFHNGMMTVYYFVIL